MRFVLGWGRGRPDEGESHTQEILATLLSKQVASRGRLEGTKIQRSRCQSHSETEGPVSGARRKKEKKKAIRPKGKIRVSSLKKWCSGGENRPDIH